MSSLNLTKRAFRAMTTAIPAITAALMMLQSGAAEAKPTVETLAGLNTGDTYNLIYITSTKRDATSSTLTDYDAFVDSAAASGSRTDHIAT